MKIVVDSGCDFTEEMKRHIGGLYERAPLTLLLDDKQFIDDGSLVIPDYVNEMEKCSKGAKTAAPSPELFLEKFKHEGAVFAVTLSSKLSASYANAMLAKQMCLEEFTSKFIHVFDSLSAACGETLIALKINELVEKNLQDSEIVASTTRFIEDLKTYFILERFDNIIKNGRMNPLVGRLAGLIGIRPICAGVNGKMEIVDKARGTAAAFTKLINTISNEKIDFENRILAISYSTCLEKALSFKEEILRKVKFKDVIIMQMSGLCATYAERGSIIVAY